MTATLTDPATLTAQLGAPSLAVDIVPDTAAGAFTLDVSDVDGPDLLAWGWGEGDWLNVVCDVTHVTGRRGATQTDGILTKAEAGVFTVTLLDYQRRFDPTANADIVHKGTPVRLRAWGYDPAGERWDAVLFTGALDEPRVQYTRSGPPVVTFTCTDVIAQLAGWRSDGRPDPGVGAGDDLLQRVARVLAECRIGALSPDCDGDYTATLAPSALGDPWNDIDQARTAELGRVWVDNANRLVVRARDSELAGTVRGTLSDTHGEAPVGVHCCISDDDPPVIVHGPESVVNRAMAVRANPAAGITGTGEPEKTRAAQLIYDRLVAGDPIRRDWTWDAAPTVVLAHRQELRDQWESDGGGDEGPWLRDYITANPIVLDLPAPVLQRVDDTASQAAYGTVTVEDRGLLLESDPQVAAWCRALVNAGAAPALRVEQVTPLPSPTDLDNALEAWAAVCATDIGDRWVLRIRPQSGPTVEQAVGVLGIQWEITPDMWHLVWTTTGASSPTEVNPGGWFVVNLSEVDGDDLLPLFPGPAPDDTDPVPDTVEDTV
jgi:hypothetical protein